MNSEDFPSGPWTGYYQYSSGQRGSQDLVLVFQNGRMTGSGHDELGGFEIQGSYDDGSKEADWLKVYPDGHEIIYRGFREGPVPGIWGTWNIPGNWSGGFHIWPLASSSKELESMEAAEKQTRQQPALLPG
ncbi:MAG: hypothetical protein V4662_19750 [Verrucomicrobiota bacterium]